MTEARATLRYGSSTRDVALPASIAWEIIETGTEGTSPLDRASIARALEVPTYGPPLSSALLDASAVVIVTPDRTRAAGLDRLLPVVLEHVTERVGASIPVHVLSGGGTHAPDDVSLVNERVPAPFRDRVVAGVHDARDATAHVEVGTTRRGTRVALDRRVIDGSKVVIVVGAIGFHYFAGFTGGRKGLFPGLGGYESVRANHRHVLARNGTGIDPACRPGNLQGNPVHEDLVEAVGFVPGPVFLVNACCDVSGALVDVYTGALIDAHAIGCHAYGAAHTLSITRPVDVLLVDAGGHPRDIDLVQTHKSLVHAAPALRPGGMLVLLAECREGAGSETFLPWFAHAETRAMESAMRADYLLNAHTALSFRRLTERYEVLMVTSLDDRVVEMLGARACTSPEAQLARARSATGDAPRGLVLSQPTSVIVETSEGEP